MAAVDIVIRQPDDWHVHLRDGEILAAVLPYTAAQFGRAIVMPNLKPPVTTVRQAAEYRGRIRSALPTGAAFEPLMTCYLTDTSDPAEIARGFSERIWVAAKLYPAGATTNSHHGPILRGSIRCWKPCNGSACRCWFMAKSPTAKSTSSIANRSSST